MVREWISANHVPLPKPGEREPTLMEEMAQREEAQRAVSAGPGSRCEVRGARGGERRRTTRLSDAKERWL